MIENVNSKIKLKDIKNNKGILDKLFPKVNYFLKFSNDSKKTKDLLKFLSN